MEVEMQLDDDVFFAELSKRISLLITDDDEADFAASQFPAAVHLPPVSPPPFHPFYTSCFLSYCSVLPFLPPLGMHVVCGELLSSIDPSIGLVSSTSVGFLQLAG